MLLFVSLSLASEPTPDDCEYYMGLGATKSSVAGRTCCYKKGLSLERETKAGHGCGHVGCDYTEGDYCEHAGHALKVPHTAAERDFVATLTAGDDDDTGVWIQTRRRMMAGRMETALFGTSASRPTTASPAVAS